VQCPGNANLPIGVFYTLRHAHISIANNEQQTFEHFNLPVGSLFAAPQPARVPTFPRRGFACDF